MAPKTGLYIGIGVSVGVLAIGAIVVAVILHQGNSIGEPTAATTSPGFLDKIDIDLDLSKITTPPSKTAKEAEPIYQAAVKEIAAQGDDLAANVDESIKTAVAPEKNPVFKSIMDKIEAAADKGLADSETLDFDATLPLTPSTEWTAPRSLFDKLDVVRRLLTRSAMMMQDANNRDGAEKAIRGELIWGVRLYKNSPFIVYKSAGMAALSDALVLYRRQYAPDLANDSAKAVAAQSFYDDIYRPAFNKWSPKERIVRSPKPGPAPADLWNIAENDKDPAWNLEGILWLGVGQWVWADGAQRAAIQKYLEQKMSSPDPRIAKFAAAAFKTPRAGSGDFGR